MTTTYPGKHRPRRIVESPLTNSGPVTQTNFQLSIVTSLATLTETLTDPATIAFLLRYVGPNRYRVPSTRIVFDPQRWTVFCNPMVKRVFSYDSK